MQQLVHSILKEKNILIIYAQKTTILETGFFHTDTHRISQVIHGRKEYRASKNLSYQKSKRSGKYTGMQQKKKKKKQRNVANTQ